MPIINIFLQLATLTSLQANPEPMVRLEPIGVAAMHDSTKRRPRAI